MKQQAWSIMMAAAILSCASFAHAQTVPASTPGIPATSPAGELHLTGQTEPNAKVDVPAGMKGLIATIDVKEGQAVKKGDRLAQLDDAIQIRQVQLTKLEAESDMKIKEAENNLDFAKNEFDKIKKIQPNTAEARQKELLVRQWELHVQQEKEDQKQKQLKLEQEKITLERMTIKSPIDGAVLRVNKQPGEQTDENPLIVVVQVSKLHAVFYPPKQLFGKIKVGDKVSLDFATEPPVKREAVVSTIDPIIEQSLFRVKFDVDNADAKIPAGTAVTWNWSTK